MISEQEVYDALSYRWRTLRQIRGKIAEAKGKKTYNIAITTVYKNLDSLVRQGFVEFTKRKPTKEESAKRGDYEVCEYKRVSGRSPVYDEPLEELGDLGPVPVQI